jgi:hypothetical protein
VCPNIEIDETVWDLLKQEAEPLVDTPNTVLRRLLGIGGQPQIRRSGHDAAIDRPTVPQAAPPKRTRSSSKGKRQRRAGARAPVGSLLPESEYERPILSVLGRYGGSAPARDVVERVGSLVADRLTSLDQETQPNGVKRWESRVQFTRLRMRKARLIEAGSPRGVWELSEQGRQAYDKLRAAQ